MCYDHGDSTDNSSFLLSIIPRADLYTDRKFSPEAMVRLLSQTHIPDYQTWRASREQPQQYNGESQLGPYDQYFTARPSATPFI